MSTSSFLTLNEAIAVALININKGIRRASFEEIAALIEKRRLYLNRNSKIPLINQIISSVKKSIKTNQNLFEELSGEHIGLKDTYSDFPFHISEVLDAILSHNDKLFNTPTKKLKVKDVQLKLNRLLEVNAADIVCIQSQDANNKISGRKKYIYLKEVNIKGEKVIGVYTIQKSLKSLFDLLDPYQTYLAIISDNTLVNVKFYELAINKILQPNGKDPIILKLPTIKFSESPVAKLNRDNFVNVQKKYLANISLQKNIHKYKNAVHF